MIHDFQKVGVAGKQHTHHNLSLWKFIVHISVAKFSKIVFKKYGIIFLQVQSYVNVSSSMLVYEKKNAHDLVE